LKGYVDYAKNYTDDDRMLAEEFIELLRDRLLRGNTGRAAGDPVKFNWVAEHRSRHS